MTSPQIFVVNQKGKNTSSFSCSGATVEDSSPFLAQSPATLVEFTKTPCTVAAMRTPKASKTIPTIQI